MLALQCLYLMIPAFFANMAPIISKRWLAFLAIPINEKAFGKNKTYRGFVFGISFSLAVAFIQYLLQPIPAFKALGIVDYSNWIAIGFLMGFGALFGDLTKSFFKRRLGIKPGSRFFPWDQLDFVFGALLFSALVIDYSWTTVIIIIAISVLGHILVNHSAYYLGIRNEKW